MPDETWESYQKLPRYVVGVEKSPNCYVDKHECKTLDEAKRKAESESEKASKKAIVFDRQSTPSIVFIADPHAPIVEEKKRGRTRS